MSLSNKNNLHFKGALTFPGDKSLSHRAALLAALAEGTSTLVNFLDASDTMNTLKAVEALGVKVTALGNQSFRVESPGARHLTSPATTIDCGNSGTGSRLLLGMLAGLDGVTAVIDGDMSLRSRPMRRVTQPLTELGAQFEYLGKPGCLPIRVTGVRLGAKYAAHSGEASADLPLRERPAVSAVEPSRGMMFTETLGSAQVKSAVILAAFASGVALELIEEIPSRDHTENMLRFAGVDIVKETIDTDEHGRTRIPGETYRIRLAAEQRVLPREYKIWGDISSVAFFAVGASLLPGSELLLRGVLLNTYRDRYLYTLKEMGAAITILPQREECGEKGGDILVRHAPLKGITIPKKDIPALIDELPILTVAGAFAEGDFTYRDAKELRVKESDRIGIMAANLRGVGIEVEEFDDGLRVVGMPQQSLVGSIVTKMDHRIVMSFEIANLVHQSQLTIEGKEWVETSFPAFYSKLASVLEYKPIPVQKQVITIDGPAGSGKSTVAYEVAEALGFNQLDSGALYRAFTYLGYRKFEQLAMENQGNGGGDNYPIAMENQRWADAIQQNTALVQYLKEVPLRLEFSRNGKQHVFHGEQELAEELRSSAVASRIKPIADTLFIRARVRELARDAATHYALVADGRDMGTEVFPEAHFKFFLTATSRVRAQRRLAEFRAKNKDITLDEVERQIITRDNDDAQRTVGALKSASTAIFIDTSSQTQKEVVSTMLAYIRYAAI